MIFAHFLADVNEANMFLAACPETRKALLVDAALFDSRLDPFLETHQLELSAVFITHDHYDHIDGLPEIVKRYGCTVYAGQENISGLSARVVRQDDHILIGNIKGRVVELPGHTPAAVGLVLPGMVFTGDALFAGSIGGTTNERNKNLQIETIRKHIFTLPDDYQIHTGHGPSSTVFVEKTYNPFFV